MKFYPTGRTIPDLLGGIKESEREIQGDPKDSDSDWASQLRTGVW